ncbi:MAG: pteridine reductase [Gammaproteobacteria bacterium]|jgi:pteridine reductase
MLAGKTVLVTGAANRIGAQIARTLHQNGANLIIHYRNSSSSAHALEIELNSQRTNSTICLQADLSSCSAIETLAQNSIEAFGQLDILVNNASSFYPTPLGSIREDDWNNLLGSNLKGPLFLSQACFPALQATSGCIVNLLDIYATSPLKNHSLYSCAKAANQMLVKSLALEMAPQVRVNGIAPGAILWPDTGHADETRQQAMLKTIPLQKTGNPDNIAQAVLFLINNDYITGEVITIDGGRQLIH